MAFEKGQSGNPTGRKPGTPNRATTTAREAIAAALAGADVNDKLTAALDGLTGKDYIDAYVKLAEFVTPKLQRTALAADAGAGKTMFAEVRVVSGYHDANGNFVKSPPLATSEKETEWELAEEERTAAGATR